MKKALWTPALLSFALALGGCTILNNATTPAPEGEDYAARTAGQKVEDDNIEGKIQDAMEQTDARLSDARIGVNSYNGAVLLFGQVPSQELKDKAGEIARNTRQVRQVHNELTVAANLPLGQRMTDNWLETRIQTELAASENVDSRHVEVIAENATIYLMGMVTRQEAQQVVDIVSGVGGVQRIIKIFEYLD
ncbi:Osmotically-inducible protein OsmY, contains BON domain [Modicisalibacter ilicicola DSM 19980]|uniref:Osmotically-inducible protein OsmY, contains BON domain n=1 Tax=Modicisalibacter ilicicola DSM 19980 TaxID=1121942 RepID=A0A1M5C6S6_9GAMM|nr:BON domain-containing protein [Halomonas ilicicola]SHF50356.1 Osmotically-inducible protein OsmY, contains BON domain [Halomonas ilicicola DSM 19980]